DAAARMEAAPGRNVGRVGHYVAEPDVRHAAARLRRQHAGEQCLRIGMTRLAEQRVGLVALDDAAEVHHRDFARDMLDHRENVAGAESGSATISFTLRRGLSDANGSWNTG